MQSTTHDIKNIHDKHIINYFYLLLKSMFEHSDMITPCHVRDYIPCGRNALSYHPGKYSVVGKSADITDNGLPFIKAFQDFTIGKIMKVC